ncbi:hypothetical protein, partial [Thermogutta sp.]|uniref:hypothetical protein n=1 Tax=Thermogutta sp. TaxID=1962930 RepID=UPI00322099C2
MAELQKLLSEYTSLEKGKAFFAGLGYPVMDPLPLDLEGMPSSVREMVRSVVQLAQVGDGTPFRIFHVELSSPALRRTDIRRFLEAYYRRFPQGENLFVFSASGQADELAFVSPRRLPDPRDPSKVRLWLRIL